MLAIAAIFVALHFVHLQADFPNYSEWNDWSKYTDEGWYGDAAIRHYQLGHWYVTGDFNPRRRCRCGLCWSWRSSALPVST